MSFEQLFEQAEQARAYIRITKEQGPSEQLLAFINYDGNLFSDVGLESLGLENMSLNTRHELLVSKLNPDQLEEMAMEGLVERIDKISQAMLKGGAIATGLSHITDSPILKALGAVSVVSGTVLKLTTMATSKHVHTYKFIKDIEEINKNKIELFKYVNSAIPTDLSNDAWVEFDLKVGDKVTKENRDWYTKWADYFVGDFVGKNKYYRWKLLRTVGNFNTRLLENVTFAASGWDSDKLKDSSKYIRNSVDTYHSTFDQFRTKVQNLQSKIKTLNQEDLDNHRTALKHINTLVSYQSKFIRDIGMEIEFLEQNINKVAKCFVVPIK